MCFEKFLVGCGTHLRRDYAHQVIFERKAVDQGDFVSLDNNAHRARKFLSLAPFPMEVDSYRNIGNVECAGLFARLEVECFVLYTLPCDFAVGAERECLRTFDFAAGLLRVEVLVEYHIYLASAHYAYVNPWFHRFHA